jgi:hypothetical protein
MPVNAFCIFLLTAVSIADLILFRTALWQIVVDISALQYVHSLYATLLTRIYRGTKLHPPGHVLITVNYTVQLKLSFTLRQAQH